jgi:hypothetical protein
MSTYKDLKRYKLMAYIFLIIKQYFMTDYLYCDIILKDC